VNPEAKLAVIVMTAALTAAVGRAQSPPQDQKGTGPAPPAGPPPAYRADTRLVAIDASVTDTSGHFVRHLTKNDFEVRDNGRLQPITFFTAEVEPISAVVLLDASRSVVNGLERVVAAADHFVVRLRPGDRAKIGSFADDIRLNPDFTADRDELSRRVNDLFDLRVGQVTRLWDAVQRAIDAFDDAGGRKVVVVFTDGDDTYSTTTFDAVLDSAHRAGVRLYIVLIDGLDRLPEERMPEESAHLQDLSPRTGGGYYTLEALGDFNAASTRMTDELHSLYLLGFTPDALDGRVHQLDVKVKRPGVSVRARRDYLASALGISTNK